MLNDLVRATDEDLLGNIEPAIVLSEVHARMSVPSTEKCSSDSGGLTALSARMAASNLRAMSVVRRRSRFLVKTVGTHTGSSMPSPTNQRNSSNGGFFSMKPPLILGRWRM
jgi:hypothetical protein